MLTDGLKLMIVGLSMVFIFLAFMILIITMLSKVLRPIVKRMESDSLQRAAKPATAGAVMGRQQEEKALTAAIMTAVYRYRTDRKKK